MSLKKKHKLLFLIILGLKLFSTITIFQRDNKSSTLFSWAIDDTEELIYKYQKPLKINRVFQYIYPDEFTSGSLDKYLFEMNKRNVSVYAMDGGYYWGTTDYGYEEFTSFVDQVGKYNSINDELQIEGIVLDVEPAQDQDWKHNEDGLMKQYVDNMIKAYQYASSKNLKVVVCITYWYDEKHGAELRRLIEQGCDEVAVMNYCRGKEINLIETEVSIAKEYNKPIINIFEFDKPDNEAVFDQNTYYHQGPYVAQEVFKEVDEYFNYRGLTAGWHQLR